MSFGPAPLLGASGTLGSGARTLRSGTRALLATASALLATASALLATASALLATALAFWARICLVEPPTLKYHSYIRVHLSYLSLALRALFDGILVERLELFKFMAAAGTGVLVGRHGGNSKEVRG